MNSQVETQQAAGNYQVVFVRGKMRQGMLIKGDIGKWLLENKARPTRDESVFIIGGWRAIISRLSDETMAAMHRIFEDPKYKVEAAP